MTTPIIDSRQAAHKAARLLLNANWLQAEADRLHEQFSNLAHAWADQESEALGLSENEIWQHKDAAKRDKTTGRIYISGHRVNVNAQHGHPPFLEMLIFVVPAKYNKEAGLIHTLQWPVAKLLDEYEPTGRKI